MTKRIATVLALVAAMSASALAQTIEATPAPKPAPPDFAPMRFMVGTWSCSTQSSRRPAAFTTTTTWSMDPSGYWMVGKSETASMAWFPYRAANEDRITYDPDTGRWIDSSSGDFGGYDLSWSPGWQNGSIVWHDLAFTKGKDVATTTDLTMTKVSDTKMTTHSGFTTVKGASVSVDGTCNKSST
jgi:hypothetical protein